MHKNFFQSVICNVERAKHCVKICNWRCDTILKRSYRAQDGYGKCSKNSNTKVSDKMTYANSADPDQTAPEGAV